MHTHTHTTTATNTHSQKRRIVRLDADSIYTYMYSLTLWGDDSIANTVYEHGVFVIECICAQQFSLCAFAFLGGGDILFIFGSAFA